MREATKATAENPIKQGMWQFILDGELLRLREFLQCRNTGPYCNASKFVHHRLHDGERNHR